MKKSPFLGTYLAVAVLAGLGSYIYFVEMKREGTPTKTKEKVFAGLDKGKVMELDLAAAGESVHLVKDKDGWRLTAPLAVSADAGEVDGIVSTLAGLEIEEVVAEAPEALADYGLQKPRSTVAVLVQGATEPHKLLVGEKTPDGGAVYAKLPAQPRVFTLPAYVESSLAKKPFDLRDRSLLHVKREDIRSLEITGPEGAYALARGESDDWAFTRPLSTRAGRWSVDSLLGALESLRMESVAAESATDVKAYGLAPPARTVTLGLADGTRKTLEIGSAAGGAGGPENPPASMEGESTSPPRASKHHARLSGRPLVAVIPGALVEDLAKGMGELRAKRVLDVATYDVEGFDAALEGAKRVYAKSTEKDKEGVEASKWMRKAPEAKDVDTSKVQDAIFAIGGTEALEFVDQPRGPEAYGLDKPLLRVTLRFSGGKPPVWFEVGAKEGASYARREGDEAILKLDPAKAEALLKAFREI